MSITIIYPCLTGGAFKSGYWRELEHSSEDPLEVELFEELKKSLPKTRAVPLGTVVISPTLPAILSGVKSVPRLEWQFPLVWQL